jgi:hypothetical protein
MDSLSVHAREMTREWMLVAPTTHLMRLTSHTTTYKREQNFCPTLCYHRETDFLSIYKHFTHP